MQSKQPPHQTSAQLRILQTTDLHMCLMPFDYVSNRAGGNYSLARLAPQVTALRTQGPDTLLFDTGDFLQGNQLASYAIENAQAGMLHPMVAAMNLLRYDAITLGNHDFDFGLGPLQSALEHLKCPVVLANVAGQDGSVFPPHCLIHKDITCDDGRLRTLKVGVIGFVTPQTVFEGKAARDQSLSVSDIVTTATVAAPRLKAAGADIIIALCHCGIGSDTHVKDAINAAAALAQVPEIDVLLAGHVHDIFPDPTRAPTPAVDPVAGTLYGKPATMAGAFGSHLGQIDLDLTWDAGAWSVRSSTCHVIATSNIADRPNETAVAIASSVSALHQQTLSHFAAPMTRTDHPIQSYFAQIHADDSLRQIATAKRAIMADILADTPESHLPHIAAAAPYRAGGRAGPNHFVDIPQGEMTLRDAGALYPFANSLATFRCSGAALRQRLEHAAGQFRQLTQGGHNQPLLDPDFAAYNADTLFGLTYDIDLSQPAAHGRIRNLCYSGHAVQPDDTFLLTTNSFRMRGGGGYHPIAPDDIVHVTAEPFQDLLATYLRSCPMLRRETTRVWNFTQMPDTTAVFPSSPRAKTYLSDLTDRTVTAGAMRADGFCDYILTL